MRGGGVLRLPGRLGAHSAIMKRCFQPSATPIQPSCSVTMGVLPPESLQAPSLHHPDLVPALGSLGGRPSRTGSTLLKALASPKSEALSCTLAAPVISPRSAHTCPAGRGTSHARLPHRLATPALGLPPCQLPPPNPTLCGGPAALMPPASLLGLCCHTAAPSVPVCVPRSLSPGSREGAPRSVTFRIPGCRLQTLAQPRWGHWERAWRQRV